MTTQKNDQSHIQNILQKFIEEPTKDELISIYDTWCKTYDTDLQSIGYVSASSSAELLSNELKKLGFDLTARIVDMGCGTGMVGDALLNLGYNNIDGIDMSEESLKVAKGKGIYKNLTRGFMASDNSQGLGVKANDYDAAICVGVLTMGHVRGNGLDDFVYAVKPGGLACFSIRGKVLNDPMYGFEEKMEELCQKKKWELVKKVELTFCKESTNMAGYLYAYKCC